MNPLQITSEQYNSILKKHGKITSALIELETGMKIPKGKKVKVKSSTKQLSQVMFYLRDKGIEYKTEHQFAKPRKFRFDLSFTHNGKGYAIEYEGMVTERNKAKSTGKSGHTTFNGYSSNCEKYNLAAKIGWTVLRYTVLTIDSAIQDLEKLLNIKT